MEMKLLADKARTLADQAAPLRLLFRLHQAKMPLRQGNPGMAGERTEHRNAGGHHRSPPEVLMPRARDAIEDHAGKPDARAAIAQSGGDRRGCLRLAGWID